MNTERWNRCAQRRRAQRFGGWRAMILAIAAVGLLLPEAPASANEVTVELLRSGRKIVRLKTLDPEKGVAGIENHLVTRSGRRKPINDAKAEKLIVRERQRLARKQGALTKSFFAKLSQASEDERFTFMAVVPVDTASLPPRPSSEQFSEMKPEQVEKLLFQHRMAVKEALLHDEVPFLLVEAKIAKYGGSARRSAVGPFLYGELPAKELLKLSRYGKLGKGIYECGHKVTDELNDSCRRRHGRTGGGARLGR